jgi:hypothetical protein
MPQQLASLILDMVEVKGEKVKGKRAKEKIYEFNTTDISSYFDVINKSVMMDTIINSLLPWILSN